MPEVSVGWRDIVQAFVIALMIVMIDESFDVGFEITRQEVVFQQNEPPPVFRRLITSCHATISNVFSFA